MDTVEVLTLASNLILVATLGVMAMQTREMTKQSAANALATSSAVYQAIADSVLDIDRLFIERPELRPYFYDAKPLPKAQAARSQVLATAELLVDFLDNMISQSPHLPDDLARPYLEYLAFLGQSPAVRVFWAENREWYSRAVRDQLDPVCAE